jgi:hypothetical protein
VEVNGLQVGTAGAWSKHPQLMVALWLTAVATMRGLASSNTLICPSWNCWHHRRTICIDMTSGPYTSTRQLQMFGGHAIFHCPVFNTALHWHRLFDEGCTSHKNEEGCLWTQNTVTHQQFYVVPGNKMQKLIFRIFYVNN